jgi:hypothetical protein
VPPSLRTRNLNRLLPGNRFTGTLPGIITQMPLLRSLYAVSNRRCCWLLAAAASAAAVAVIGGSGPPPLVMGQERDVELARGRRVRGCANEPHVRWMPTPPSLHLSTCPPVRTCLPFACLFAGSPACLPACKPVGLPSLAYVHVQTRTNTQTHAHKHAQWHTRTHRHLQTDG